MIGVDGTKSHLIDILLMSEKRKKVVLLLKDGPRGSDEIKSILGLSSSSVMPQIKILIVNHIVVQKEHTYYLSQIGHLLAHHMIPLLNISNTLEENLEYWTNHDISGLPVPFQLRLYEIGNSVVVEPEPEEPYGIPLVVKKSIMGSNYVHVVASFFHPSLIPIYKKIDEEGVNMVRISTKAAIQKLVKSYSEYYGEFPLFESTKFRILENELNIAAVVITDDLLCIYLNGNKGLFMNNMIVSSSDGAVKWGLDYFKYYLERSTPLDLKKGF